MRLAHVQIYLSFWGIFLFCGLGGGLTATQTTAFPSHPPTVVTPTPQSLTSPLTDTEVSVLQQVLANLECFDPTQVSIWNTSYNFTCWVGTVHLTDVSITRYNTPTEADAAFVAIHGDATESFGCYPANTWMYYDDPEHFADLHRKHLWVANKWLIFVHSFDEYVFANAYEPRVISQLVMQAAQWQLFPACHRLYLPSVFLP